MDLLATINIKLLYKAPVDNIKGLAGQSEQSSSITRTFIVLGGDRGDTRQRAGSQECVSVRVVFAGCEAWRLGKLDVVCCRVCRAALSHGSAS